MTGRHLGLILVLVASLAMIAIAKPIPQLPEYHAFADGRTLLRIPNALNVLSNVPFLLIGLAGARCCLRRPSPARPAWIALFLGTTLVGAGSAVYHWNPCDATLVWDRLPMAIAFMGLFAALIGENVCERLAMRLFVPILILGPASVLYWQRTDDLRLYYWVQGAPLLLIPVITVLFRTRHTHRWVLLVALGWYGLAKIAEPYDLRVFDETGALVSGHTIKHLLAAAGCACLLEMLTRRQPVRVAEVLISFRPGGPDDIRG